LMIASLKMMISTMALTNAVVANKTDNSTMRITSETTLAVVDVLIGDSIKAKISEAIFDETSLLEIPFLSG
jgi:hypothetical protein